MSAIKYLFAYHVVRIFSGHGHMNSLTIRHVSLTHDLDQKSDAAILGKFGWPVT